MRPFDLLALALMAVSSAVLSGIGCTAASQSAASTKPLALSGYRSKAAAAEVARKILASVRGQTSEPAAVCVASAFSPASMLLSVPTCCCPVLSVLCTYPQGSRLPLSFQLQSARNKHIFYDSLYSDWRKRYNKRYVSNLCHKFPCVCNQACKQALSMPAMNIVASLLQQY